MAVAVVGVPSRAQNCGIVLEAPMRGLRGEWQVALIAAHEVPDEQRPRAVVLKEGATVAVVVGPPVIGGHRSSGERGAARGRDEEGRPYLVEEAEHGRRAAVEIAEAEEEAGVVDEAAPVLGDEGGAEEVDGLRRARRGRCPGGGGGRPRGPRAAPGGRGGAARGLQVPRRGPPPRCQSTQLSRFPASLAFESI